MSLAPTLAQRTHALLVLGRVSNLPTVWSNCLAAWLLGGGGRWQNFALLCLGATLLYTGGMFLNDAFDVEFDRQYRRERPIISGQVSVQFVWLASAAFLCLGWLAIFPLGTRAAVFAGLLLACIVAYNAVHKRTQLAPLLMASCRFLLYLVSASAAQFGAGRSVAWPALALFCYVVGLSYLARVESTGVIVSRWPAVLLFFPLLMAFIFGARTGAQFWVAAVAQSLWVLWCLTGGLPPARRFLNSGVAGLLAGIPLVDWLGVGCWPVFGLAFPICFLLALILQRVAPAT
jgi:4-hydroxybenzoate polyprenyltransferase